MLIAVRLSIETDSTTSPERQLEECRAYCERRGWEVVGVAKDLDVSATRYAPWQRPELKTWLEDRAPEFDNIVFWRLDRFVRKVGDLHTMIEWAENHGKKGLVSATEPFDLTDPFGEVMATMIAAFARMEARAVSERVTSMRAHLLHTTRWGGGNPPYGYETYEKDKGRYLRINPGTAKVAQEAAQRVIDGESISSIAQDFEERGIPSPTDTYKRRKQERDYVWHPATLKRILSNQGLMGYKTRSEQVPGKKYAKRVFVYDEEGKRIRMADPVLPEEKWEELQKCLTESSIPSQKPGEVRTPFLGVIECGGCGKNLQLHTTKKTRKDGTVRATSKIRCLSRPGSPACKGYVFDPETEIVGPLRQALMNELGDKPVTRRVYVQGDGSDEKLEEIEESINYHVAQLQPGGIYAKGMLREKGEKALLSLQDEYERLSSLGELGRDRWEYQELGMTFSERWNGKDIATITDDLVRAGVKMKCHPREKGGHQLEIPEDLQERFAKMMA